MPFRNRNTTKNLADATAAHESDDRGARRIPGRGGPKESRMSQDMLPLALALLIILILVIRMR